VLFVGQLWARARGISLERPPGEFALFGVPWWGYFVPHPGLRLAWPVGTRLYADPEIGGRAAEVGSYLGLVTLGLLALGAWRGTRTARPGLWWALLGLMVVLSFGATVRVAGVEIPMPAGWVRAVFPPMRSLRVPARFNLFAMVIAAVLAAGALARQTGRLPARARWGIAAGLAVVAVLDLGYTRFPTSALPPAPESYRAIVRAEPGATFVEVPQADPFGGADAATLNAVAAYWQSHHHGRTTAGYTAVPDPVFLHGPGSNSPFLDRLVASPGYADGRPIPRFDLHRNVDLAGLIWLYLDTYRIDHIALHHWVAEARPGYREPLARLGQLLGGAPEQEDDLVSIYPRGAVPPPTRPVSLPTAGWSGRRAGADGPTAALAGRGLLASYNPDAGLDLEFVVEAAAARRPRRLRLLAGAGAIVLAEWTIPPGRPTAHVSPAFRLPAGHHELILEVVAVEGDREGRAPPIRVSVAQLRAAPGAPAH
jgi:hypothetical protein